MILLNGYLSDTQMVNLEKKKKHLCFYFTAMIYIR